MNSWIYLFSRFTAELILFQAFVICSLLALYSGYWILVKRRLGLGSKLVPAEVVQHYLKTLIFNTEDVKTQLFGESTLNLNTRVELGGNVDVALLEKIALLETQIKEKDKMVLLLNKEKESIEKQLLGVKTDTPPSTAGGSLDPLELNALKDKIQNLEERLAEYSVIEDDLANLKKLQQENTQLKSLLNSSGIPVPEFTSTQTPTSAPTLATASATTSAPTPKPTEPQTPTPVAAAPPPAPPPPAPPQAAPPPPAAAKSPSTPPEKAEKNDEDLVAEFEKMLKN